MGMTLDQLKKMSVHDRHTIWERTKTREDDEARSVRSLIEESGLNYGANWTKLVSLDDAIGKRMQRIVFSTEAKRAALAATAQGLPALAGVDPILKAGLGNDYGAHNEATIQAGYLVTNLMRQLGYDDDGQGPLPSHCVAKSGKKFRLSKRDGSQV